MTGINALIYYLHEKGLGRTIYDSAFPVIVVTLFLYFCIYRKKYDIPIRKALVLAVCMIATSAVLSAVLAWIEFGFKNAGGGDILRVFAFLPLMCLLLAKILKIKVGIITDFVAPAIVIWHIIGQSVCPFLGCCAGIRCEWGIWNPVLDCKVFPAQWATCLALLVILVQILRYQKKHKYDGNGKSYPLLLIVYGATRFLLEFLRLGNKLFGGISNLALHALLMFLVGATWLITLNEIELQRSQASEPKS